MEDNKNENDEGYNLVVNGKLLIDMMIELQAQQNAFMIAFLNVVAPEVDQKNFFEQYTLAGIEATKTITRELYGKYGEGINLDDIMD